LTQTDIPVTGHQVREYRARKGIGLRTVEKLTGINRGKISWWERGADILSEEEVDRVIDAVIAAP
jgi:transcriptional regulator with XRE-family HTH domain